MVYVYITDVSNLTDPLVYPELMEGLPKDRREKIIKYRQLKDRRQSLGAGLLLKRVLEKHGVPMKDFSYLEHGKPVTDGICFNLSHSHDKVVCAVSKEPVGIDIEKIEPLHANLAERFFTENEIRYLNRFYEEEKQQEFFRLWTMKESYMKYTGEGMSLSLDCFEFVIGEKVSVYRHGQLCDCSIKEYEVPGYKLTVCSKEKDYMDMKELV